MRAFISPGGQIPQFTRRAPRFARRAPRFAIGRRANNKPKWLEYLLALLKFFFV